MDMTKLYTHLVVSPGKELLALAALPWIFNVILATLLDTKQYYQGVTPFEPPTIRDSFLSQQRIEKEEANLPQLKREREAIFGVCSKIFLGIYLETGQSWAKKT